MPDSGRTLVFVNSIACLRRLVSIMQVLELPIYPLHAEMQQRQRLKNLDRCVAVLWSVLVSRAGCSFYGGGEHLFPRADGCTGSSP